MDHNKNILVTGGSGFIGSALCKRLLSMGCDVSVLTRDKNLAREKVPGEITLIEKPEELPREKPIHVVVNLAGEPLVAGRWNRSRKQAFYDSRIGTTQRLLEFFRTTDTAPEVLLSGSAVGYYGPSKNSPLDESGVFHDCFSHQLCNAWENAASAFSQLGTRVCFSRTGIVLGPGGALSRMLPAFRFGMGGPLGNGCQWMSWIHRDDLVALMLHCIRRTDIRGPVNGTAPNPVTNREFSKTLGKVLSRPALMTMPSFAARLLFGEMADELLLTGQRVIPRKAMETSFQFEYPKLEDALRQLLGR